jgi:deoxycytidylate deaminase
MTTSDKKKSARRATTFSDLLLIGLTGSFGSGCTTAAKYLAKRGFRKYSLSDEIRKIAAKRISDATRDNYQDIGDELRKTKSPSYLAELVFAKIAKSADKKIVVESIRNHNEVLFFKRTFGRFFLINIDAPYKVRWERVKNKYTSESDFHRHDERDKGDNQPGHGQHVSKCVDLADIVINNDATISSLKQKLARYLDLFESPGTYVPQDTEMCMSLAYLWSLKSRCLKRKVGAVIVKHGHVIASGYNDPPKRLGTNSGKVTEYQVPHCRVICYRELKVKCSSCGQIISSAFDTCPNPACRRVLSKEDKDVLDKHLDLCRSIHAEERAILQTAKLGGQSLQDTTIYTTTFPCLLCAKKIIESGISDVVYIDPYPYRDAYEMMRSANVTLHKFEGVKSRMIDVLYATK